LTIVGTVMAQTVALDYYAVAADRMIESFMKMNLKIEDRGNFNELKIVDLHKLIASNNSVITNVLSKLGIFEGSDAGLFIVSNYLLICWTLYHCLFANLS